MRALTRQRVGKQYWDQMLVERRTPNAYYSSFGDPGNGWHEGTLHPVREHENVYEIKHKGRKNEFVRKNDPNFRFTRIDG